MNATIVEESTCITKTNKQANKQALTLIISSVDVYKFILQKIIKHNLESTSYQPHRDKGIHHHICSVFVFIINKAS